MIIIRHAHFHRPTGCGLYGSKTTRIEDDARKRLGTGVARSVAVATRPTDTTNVPAETLPPRREFRDIDRVVRPYDDGAVR
jgi:hypothetical protein